MKSEVVVPLILGAVVLAGAVGLFAWIAPVPNSAADSAPSPITSPSTPPPAIRSQPMRKISDWQQSPLAQAIVDGSDEQVRRAFQYEPDAMVIGPGGQSLLHLSVNSFGSSIQSDYVAVTITKMLIARGAPVDQVDAEGFTALALSVYLNKSNAGQLAELIAAGADVNARNRFGRTPLHEAARSRANMVPFLIGKGADINALASDGQTALHIAAAMDERTAMKVLIDAGANLNIRDKQGYTPLRRARLSFRDGAAEMLVKAGATE